MEFNQDYYERYEKLYPFASLLFTDEEIDVLYKDLTLQQKYETFNVDDIEIYLRSLLVRLHEYYRIENGKELIDEFKKDMKIEENCLYSNEGCLYSNDLFNELKYIVGIRQVEIALRVLEI